MLNSAVTDEVALNLGEGEKLVGIEIVDAKETLGSGEIPEVILENLTSRVVQQLGFLTKSVIIFTPWLRPPISASDRPRLKRALA